MLSPDERFSMLVLLPEDHVKIFSSQEMTSVNLLTARYCA